MFLNHATTEASATMQHNAVDADLASTLQQSIKTFGDRIAIRQSLSSCAKVASNYRIKRASNKSTKRTTKSVAACLNR